MTAVMEPPTVRLDPGTPDTVTQLVDLYRGRREQLVRLASRYTRDRDRAEDAVQEAFLNLVGNPTPRRVTGELVSTLTRYGALAEARQHNEQVPVGEAMDWQADTTPPTEDLDTLSACMGSPAVGKAVDEALSRLPERHATAIRLRMLTSPPVKVSEIAERLGVTGRTVYEYLNAGLAALTEMHVELPDEDPQPAPDAAPARRSSRVPTIEELTATLDREHPGQWLGPDPAHETLRRVHGSCSAKRAALAQKAHNAPLTPPMRIRAGLGPESLAAANAELVATLGREFPGRTVTNKEAEETLRRIHTTCSLGRARQARTEHNALVTAAMSPNTTVVLVAPEVGARRPVIAKASAHEGVSVPTPSSEPATFIAQVAGSEPAASRGPMVAEVWLMGAKPPISCLLVHTDETTASRVLAAVSMLGAQREITGQLIGDGYRPDGSWVDIDPAGPEAMRKFQMGGAS